MRIAILTTQCPFVVGGAELHARGLERALREAGHEAEIIAMPFKWYPAATVLDCMLAARCLDVSEFTGVKIDLAIGLKFPAWLMGHPNKIFWVLHQHRQAYDLWDAGDSNLFDDENGQITREAIRAADNAELGAGLGAGRRVFANSANVAQRLRRYNNIEATPLYHPPPLADRLTSGDFGDYFYYPSRISPLKRQDFVLRALALAHKSARVIFSGAPDSPEYGRELMRLARDLGVEGRVEWRGFVGESEMIDLYAGARGVLFTPVDEDLGYIALEAMLAGKPLLTLADSGEPAALARHEVEGLVVAPQPKAFAAAMDRLVASSDLARSLGEAGLARYRALDVSWNHAVATLIDAGSAGTGSGSGPMRAAPPPPAREAEKTADADVPGQLSATDWLARDHRAAPRAGPSLAALAARYGFDDHLARHRDYYETHWPRYQATLDTLLRSGVRPRRVLELGTSEPYLFTALLAELFPGAEFTVIQESPAGLHWRHRIGREGGPTDGGGVDVAVFGLNVETTPLPFADGRFDLVIAMEILEHLAVDPGFVLREARRVLGEGGALLVTTPNLVSLPAVARALDGVSPYSFGVFVPWHGVYGRHNREYTPLEVESLGRYAGLETALLDTADVYRQGEVAGDLVGYMSERGHPLGLRGQNIFYLGRKTAAAAAAPFPEALFPIDPAIFSADVQLRRARSGPAWDAGDHFALRLVNTSPLTWPAAGAGRVRLTVDKVDQDGLVTLDAQAFDLPRDVAPGETLEIPVRAVRGAGVFGLWHEIGLYAEGAGPFKGAGRAGTARLFAEALEWAPARACDGDAA
jgi:glycosyltransferase involved in cell wall biosynthesis/SAM-dependent methyltransferase